MLTSRTRVAIVGAGPAGLLLAYLLGAAGIESVVLDKQSREEIERTVRSGVLEQAAIELLGSIPHSRAIEVGRRHDGIEILVDASRHRLSLAHLTGRHIWLYPQHEVLIDLLSALTEVGQELRFNTTVTLVEGITSAEPRVLGVTPDGESFELLADFVVGADGSRSVVRSAVESGARKPGIFRGYPFAWYAILCAAPPSAQELVYAHSEVGFALISQRTEAVQRMYFQCDPGTPVDAFNDEAVWETLRRRTRGLELVEGPILHREVLRFRSFTSGAMRHGRAALVGDAAHTVPPTSAKGMNLAIADVALLSEAIRMLLQDSDERGMNRYETVALRRVWSAQQFSWWMTQLLHSSASESPFEHHRRRAELRTLLASAAGRTYISEQFAGAAFEPLM